MGFCKLGVAVTERVLIAEDGPVQRRRVALMVAEPGYAPTAGARPERTEPPGGGAAPDPRTPPAREPLLPLFADDGQLRPLAEIGASAIRFAPAGALFAAAAPKRGIRTPALHRKLETFGIALLAPRDALSVAVR